VLFVDFVALWWFCFVVCVCFADLLVFVVLEVFGFAWYGFCGFVLYNRFVVDSRVIGTCGFWVFVWC